MPLTIRWINLLALLLLLLAILLRRVGLIVTCDRRQGSNDAAIYRLRGRSMAKELLLLGVKKAISKLLSEMLLRSSSKLLGGFFKLSAKGLEDY